MKRIKVQLRASEQPKTALSGTLVIAPKRPGSVSPATVPVKLAAPPTQTAPRALWHEAEVEPPTVVVKVHRWLPTPIAPRALITDAQDVHVKGLGSGEMSRRGRSPSSPSPATPEDAEALRSPLRTASSLQRHRPGDRPPPQPWALAR